MTSRDEAVERIAAVLHEANVDCGYLREFDVKSCADWSARHTNPAYSLYDAGLRVASTTGLDAAARTFLTHVAEAAEWPTPGIGCDAKCETADALRAALATPPAVAEDVTT